MVRIPSEYQEVEYIESTETQYIDTGYIPVLSPILRMRIRVTSLVDKDIAGFVSNVYPSFIIDAAPAQSRWYNRYGDTAAYGVNPRPVVGQIQEWEWGKEVKFNGNLVRTNAECDWSSNTQKMNIFSGRNNGFVAIYSCSLYDGELVRNFIPCYRKSDNEIGMYDTVSKTFFTNQGTGTFLKGNDVNYDTVNLMESRRRILLNTPHLESLTGSALSFKTDMASKLKECKIHFTPVQEGSGDPSPDNVRPIHGWDEVTVTRCGKNLVNYIDPENIRLATSATVRCKGNTDYGSISIADGVVTLTRVLEAAGLCFILGELKAGVTYTLSGTWDNTDGKAYIALLDTDIADEYSCTRKFTINFYYGKATFTPEETGVYEVLIWRGGRYAISASNVQLEVGSTATDYEPYTGTTVTIPFPQTIYGGYVDLVKGEVAETDTAYDMGNLNWNKDTVNHLFYALLSDAPNFSTANTYSIISSVRLYDRCWTLAQIRNRCTDKKIRACAGSKNIYLYDDMYETAEDFKASLNEQVVVAPNDAPTTYPLDPFTIRTLKGLNNIWSDANGNIEIKYWTH